MIRFISLLIVLMIVIVAPVRGQELEITGFPVGEAASVGKDFFRPYLPALQAIADTLAEYPLTLAVITGGADGEQYRHNSDALNPAVALGRAHTLRTLLVEEFGVDPTRIVIQSEDTKSEGPQYRFVRVRVAWELEQLSSRLNIMSAPPAPDTQVIVQAPQADPTTGEFGLQFGTGLSSTPFGGVPVATGAVSWKRVLYAEGIVGYTLWDGDFTFEGVQLDTRVRLAGGQVMFYPHSGVPVGLVAGWIRIEELSQRHYRHVKVSEGPLFGLRGSPWRFLSLQLAYNPAKRWVTGYTQSDTKTDQFLMSVLFHLNIGGGK
jgi:hypothetical protein